MRISYNPVTENILNNLRRTNSKKSSSLRKLSSGQRIQSAKDDVSGFAIANSLKADISSMTVGSRNIVDGQSMIGVAHGSLESITGILQRMGELATQAANGSYSDSERAKAEQEFTGLLDEIDRIAFSTTFNGRALLKNTTPDLDNGLVAHYDFQGGVQDSSGNGNNGTTEGQVGYVDGKFDQAASFDGNSGIVIDNFNLNSTQVTMSAWVNLESYHPTDPLVSPQIVATSLEDNGLQLEATWLARHGIIWDAPSRANRLATDVNTFEYPLDSWHHIVGYYDGTTSKIFWDTQEIASSLSGGSISYNGDTLFIARDPVSNHEYQRWRGMIDDFRIYNRAISQNEIDLLYTGSPLSIRIQYGPRVDDYHDITFGDATTSGLGVNDLSVSTQRDAQHAMDCIAQGIERCNSIFANLGAHENILDTISDIVSTKIESYQNAESVIRDTDIGQEVAELTKSQILSDAGNAMLVQANIGMRDILKLLST